MAPSAESLSLCAYMRACLFSWSLANAKLYDLVWLKVNPAQLNYQVGKKYLKLMKLWPKYKAFFVCPLLPFSQRCSSGAPMLSLCHVLLGKVLHTCGRTRDSEGFWWWCYGLVILGTKQPLLQCHGMTTWESLSSLAWKCFWSSLFPVKLPHAGCAHGL